ncbi:MAG: sulfatase-like hydrolase/transferase, partial [Bacteroidota bacterium]
DLAKYPHREGKKKTYAAMVDCMDQGIGSILNAIDQRGDRDNTFILFFSDNGGVKRVGDNYPMRGHKLTVYEGGIRVVAAAHWPEGGIEGGKIIQTLMGYIDVFPTLKTITGLQELPHKPLDGINVLGLMQGQAPKEERSWFTYLDQAPLHRERFAVHRADMKLVLERDAADTISQREPLLALYRLDSLHQESQNVASALPEQMSKLTKECEDYWAQRSKVQVPRYQDGKGSYQVPKDWIIP